jgi:hypothetical protein
MHDFRWLVRYYWLIAQCPLPGVISTRINRTWPAECEMFHRVRTMTRRIVGLRRLQGDFQGAPRRRP